MSRRIYLDHNATTPVAPEVLWTNASYPVTLWGGAAGASEW